MASENSVHVLHQLIRYLDIPLTRGSIKMELDKHPEYYSFLGLSDVLTYWQVPNSAFEIGFEQLDKIPVPFITHLSSNKGEFVVITKISNGHITINNERYNNKVITATEFKTLYTGFVLVAEKDATAGEADYRSKQRSEWMNDLHYPLLVSGLFIIFLCSLIYKFRFLVQAPILFLSLLIKLAGVVISLILALKSINIDNPFIQRICTVNANSDCNRVIFSKSAQIIQELSWAEAGMFYFAGTLLILLFGDNSLALVGFLGLLSGVSVLYTFYSIFQQAFVIKQWCILCLLVLALLWIDCICLTPPIQWHLLTLSIRDIAFMISCFLFPVILWAFINPYLKSSEVIKSVKDQLSEFKGRNIHLFQKLLSEQKYHVLLNEQFTINEGNKDGQTVITLITKPYCDACSEMHNYLSEWLATRDDIRLQVVFYVLNYDGDAETRVAVHFMQLKQQGDAHTLKEAINSWYKQTVKNFDTWVKDYPVSYAKDQSEKLEKQRLWCNEHHINFTPFVMINGRKLPDLYKLEEIKYFL